MFVYGSLLRGLHNHHLLQHSTLLAATRTRDATFRLVDTSDGEFTYPYAFASKQSPPGAYTVLGEVYEVSDDTLAALDKLEEHPYWYCRREVALDGQDLPAWMYLLVDPEELGRMQAAADCDPPGDWRSYYLNRYAADLLPGAWPNTRRSQSKSSPHPVFCFGSNGIEQMRTRCQNPNLVARRALLPNAMRVFAGWSDRWEGAVATVMRHPTASVYGSVVDLSATELSLLDGFEGVPNPDEPYLGDGADERSDYRRQDVILLTGENLDEPREAVMYVMVHTLSLGPPSERYLEACRRNVHQFWPGDVIEVRGANDMANDAAPSNSTDEPRDELNSPSQ